MWPPGGASAYWSNATSATGRAPDRPSPIASTSTLPPPPGSECQRRPCRSRSLPPRAPAPSWTSCRRRHPGPERRLAAPTARPPRARRPPPARTPSILADGRATVPAHAPAAVKRALVAGNQIIDRPYLYGGGHGTPLSELAAAYDCSGATSYLLHAAGLFGDFAQTSGQLETFGHAGPGRWITVYANSGHVFIDVAGVVLNTAWYAPVTPRVPDSGPRWQPASSIPAQYAGDQYGGFLQRHPRGL